MAGANPEIAGDVAGAMMDAAPEAAQGIAQGIAALHLIKLQMLLVRWLKQSRICWRYCWGMAAGDPGQAADIATLWLLQIQKPQLILQEV